MSEPCPFDDVPEPTRYAKPERHERLALHVKFLLWGALVILALVVGAFFMGASTGCAAIEKADAVPSAWYTPAPGYPCGPKAEVCTLKANGACGSFCREGDICPGPAGGCAAGKCCPGGSLEQDPTYGARQAADAGARASYPVLEAP